MKLNHVSATFSTHLFEHNFGQSKYGWDRTPIFSSAAVQGGRYDTKHVTVEQTLQVAVVGEQNWGV